MTSLTVGAGAPPCPRPPASPRGSPRCPRPAHSTCRAVLLGLPGVGKTALTVRLLTKRFIGEYCPTLESLYCYRETVENDEIRMEIFDTAGTSADDVIPEAYIMWANCFLLVYAITDRRSFDEAARLKRRIDAIKEGESPPCLLVGNKSDLEYDRRVRRYEGQRLARLLGCTHFFETSACDGNHVTHIADMFHTLYNDFRRHRALLAGEVETSGGGLVGSLGGGVSRQTAASSGTRHHKPAATSTKFRHAIQKVIMRSKTPQKPPSLAKLGPARESIV